MEFFSIVKAHAADLAVGAAAATSPLWLQLVDEVTRPSVEILGLLIVVVKLATAVRQYRAIPSQERTPENDA